MQLLKDRQLLTPVVKAAALVVQSLAAQGSACHVLTPARAPKRAMAHAEK